MVGLLLESNALRGRNPSHRQVDTRDTWGNRRWLGVGSQLPKLWMYLGSIVLRRSTSKRPFTWPSRTARSGRFPPIAPQHSWSVQRISPKSSERQKPTLSRHSQVGEVCLPRTLKRPLPATPGPSLASQPPPRGCHRVGATPGSLVRLIHRKPHVQDRRLRYRATRQGRYRGNGRNTLKIALKCGISADSEAQFRPTPRRSAG